LERTMVRSENAEGRLEPVEENIVRPAVEGHNARETGVEHESAPDVTQLGDRVAAVLRAAEEAAEQIRTDAQAAAERITRQADHEAKARLEESRREAVRVLSDAETQARASREAAEAMVQRIQESARSLEEEVREQERMIRGRMQRYLAGLRDVSGQIEAVLHETERDAPPLVEALNERANHQH
jgi:cell division septum initiation protein DivIVA